MVGIFDSPLYIQRFFKLQVFQFCLFPWICSVAFSFLEFMQCTVYRCCIVNGDTDSWWALTSIPHSFLKFRHFRNPQKLQIYLHCLAVNSGEWTSFLRSSSSLRAPGPGTSFVRLPTLEQGSWSPAHHPPGVIQLPFLPSNSLSILSRTGLCLRNLRANGAPLLIIFTESLMERKWGCCFGGTSQEM